jgi:hypothetical protein
VEGGTAGEAESKEKEGAENIMLLDPVGPGTEEEKEEEEEEEEEGRGRAATAAPP